MHETQILIFSSNSFFQFCILRIRKTSLFFFFFLTRVFVLRVFSICAFLRKIFSGLWSFSLKCARRLRETQTVPSDPLGNSTHKWNLLSSSGRRRNPNLQVTGSLFLLCGPVVTPTEERQSAQMETNEDWLWALLNLSWNACVQGAGPLPVWNKKSSEQAGCVCLDPSPVGSAESGPGLSADEELQTGPQIPPSVSTVVGHCLISVELGFQLGNTKRCFDAVADGLQPIKTRQEKIIFFF